MQYEDISLEIDRGVARLTFRRPGKLNALRDHTGSEMQAAFDEMESNPDVRAIVLTGEGRAFGVGYDLSLAKPDNVPDMAKILEEDYNPLIRRMRASRLPIVSVINGPCAGASVGIALAGDIVIAARSAYFYEPFVGLALIPDAGNTLFLPRAVGRIRAAGAMLLAEKITVEEALSWGLVWRVFEDGELMSRADEIAHKLAGFSPTSVSLIKKLISEASDYGLSEQLDLERDAQGEACGSSEMKAAIASFFAKRK